MNVVRWLFLCLSGLVLRISYLLVRRTWIPWSASSDWYAKEREIQRVAGALRVVKHWNRN